MMKTVQTIKQIFLILFFFIPYAGMAAAADQAELVMQIIPDEVPTGTNFNIVMQFKNTGQTTWQGEAYHLSAMHSQPWGNTRVELKPDTKIGPDETATFKFELAAPLTPGEYALQWQLHKGKVAIGEPTTPVKIRVTGNLIPRNKSEFVYQKVPMAMNAGETYSVVLQFKNTGETAWVPGQYALALPAAEDALTWTIDRVDIMPGTVIRPGEFYSFNFDIHAPDDPGVYRFQWQLLQKQSGFFGALSAPLEIEVKTSPNP